VGRLPAVELICTLHLCPDTNSAVRLIFVTGFVKRFSLLICQSGSNSGVVIPLVVSWQEGQIGQFSSKKMQILGL